MVNPAGGARQSRYPLDQSARKPETSSTDSKQKTFELQLKRSLSTAEPTTPADQGVSKRQAFANMERTRREIVANGPFGGTGVAIPAEKPAASSPANVTAEASDPLSVLRQAMQNAGIMSNIDLTISDEIVQYPGGAYRNHQIKADFGNGVTESYSVDLMIKNPWLTALEMKRLMNGAA